MLKYSIVLYCNNSSYGIRVLYSDSYGKTIGSIPTKGKRILVVEIEISLSAELLRY